MTEDGNCPCGHTQFRPCVHCETPRVNLEELKAAEAAATPLPWNVDGVGGVQMDGTSDGYVIWTEENRRLAILYPSAHKDRITRYRDANLIALMRNALPSLIAEVETLRAENEALAGDNERLITASAVAHERAGAWMKRAELLEAENEALRAAMFCVDCGDELDHLPRGICVNCVIDRDDDGMIPCPKCGMNKEDCGDCARV